eukprot:78173_1
MSVGQMYLLICFINLVNSQIINITNSTGQYLWLSKSVDESKWYLQQQLQFECNHHLFCYIICIDDNTWDYDVKCAKLTVIARSYTVSIQCVYCRDFKVITSNVNEFNLWLENSYSTQIHIEDAVNVVMFYKNVQRSIVYSQYAENFRLISAGYALNYDNVFYLDHVSNNIDFECESSFSDITISASYAKFLNISVDKLEYSDIYCPYYAENVCILDVKNINNVNIHIFDMTLDLLPINFVVDNNESTPDFTIWCNEDEYGNYQQHQHTRIYYSPVTNRLECQNITSDCCPLNELYDVIYYRDDILCNENSLCIIDCIRTIDCVNNNIITSNLTTNLNVICNHFTCFNTIIYCPNTTNSICDVSCDDSYSCYHTVIKYNANNNDITLNCIGEGSCDYTQIFVAIDSYYTQQITQQTTQSVNITCNSCHNAAFIINSPLQELNIWCIGNKSCSGVEINAIFTQHINIYCGSDGYDDCSDMIIYGKSNAANSINIQCDFDRSCRKIYILSLTYYTLDYLSITGDSAVCNNALRTMCQPSMNTIISYKKKNIYSEFEALDQDHSLRDTNVCKCDVEQSEQTWYSNLFCCPFANSYPTILLCDEGQDCNFSLDENYEGTIIDANRANGVTVSCHGCSNVKIFAMNAGFLELECTQKCYDIFVKGNYVENFNLKCIGKGYDGDLCDNLDIEVTNAKQVYMEIESLSRSSIWALHADAFTLLSRISSLSNPYFTTLTDLAIPSSSVFACQTAKSCSGFNIYSYNGITDTMQLKLCENNISDTISGWHWFCPASINYHAAHLYSYSSQYYLLDCKWHSALNRLFCDHACNHNITQIRIDYQPFSNECRGEILNIDETTISFQMIMGVTICILAFTCIWSWILFFVYLYMFLKCQKPELYKQIVYIEPPSTKLYRYLYLSDILVWTSQIYILLILTLWFSYYKNDVCNSINVIDEYQVDDEISKWQNNEAICLMFESVCFYDTNNDKCKIHSWIQQLYFLSIIAFIIAASVNLAVIPFLHCTECIGKLKSRTTIGFISNFTYMMCPYTCENSNSKCTRAGGINDEQIYNIYTKRQFFIIYSNYSRKLMLAIFVLVHGIVRYLLFFVPALILYFHCHNDKNIDFTLKWFDIFPVIFLVLLNESIKIRYKMLPAYYKTNHIVFILNRIFKENVTSVILMFLGDEYDNTFIRKNKHQKYGNQYTKVRNQH